jgi:hypothetical protein
MTNQLRISEVLCFMARPSIFPISLKNADDAEFEEWREKHLTKPISWTRIPCPHHDGSCWLINLAFETGAEVVLHANEVAWMNPPRKPH